MKLTHLLVLFAALTFAGCGAFPINATATKLVMEAPDGRKASITLPKNLDASGAVLDLKPDGTLHFEATSLRSDASGVINSAAAMQASAIEKLSDSVKVAVSALTAAKVP